MDLSIIIPNYNTKALLDRCLESIYTSSGTGKVSIEIIVIDNASKDASVKLLNTKYPRVITILNKKNLGYGAANNQGIRKAEGRYVLLLNTDIKVLDNAIEKLITFAKEKDHVFVGGKLHNEDHSPQPSAGPMYTPSIVFAMLFLKGDSWGMTRYSPDETRQVDWVSGACLMGKKQDFLKIGLFDEDIFMYMDEIDFLYRAKNQGYITFFDADAHFIHTGAASSGSRKEPVGNIYRGLMYFYTKHRSIMEGRVLRVMLKIKAYVAIFLGKITGSIALVSTYEKALRLV